MDVLWISWGGSDLVGRMCPCVPRFAFDMSPLLDPACAIWNPCESSNLRVRLALCSRTCSLARISAGCPWRGAV